MSHPYRPLVSSLLAAIALLSAPSAEAATASHPLTMAITGAQEIAGAEASLAFSRIRSSGITTIATTIGWPEAVPQQEPANWDPSNPNDPNYDWSLTDARVKAIVAAGFQPIGLVGTAPDWARLAPVTPYFTQSAPIPDKFGRFMRAAAERYSGKYPGIPRVRYWQVWNEPNIGLFFWPQFDAAGNFTSPDVYRDMVNVAAASIHAVHPDNVVIAGETAPFRDTTPQVYALDQDWGPLKFMRRMLCVDDRGRPTCDKTAAFDVWSTHPYTSGGPLHKAVLPYDVSLGDLPEMRATLDAAIRARHVQASRPVRFWVTEFSWDSNPPDRCAAPMALLKRWVPEGFYRMWANGIDLIGWFQLTDDPLDRSYFQSGLFFRAPTLAAAKAKGFLPALRFPFVALRRGARVYVWAHTPFGRPGQVVVEQTTGRRWRKVAKLRADRYGVVQAVLKVKPVGQFRAVLGGGERSLPFSMRVPPDRFFNPFGQASTLEPNGQPC
jgi:hypothetical protein